MQFLPIFSSLLVSLSLVSTSMGSIQGSQHVNHNANARHHSSHARMIEARELYHSNSIPRARDVNGSRKMVKKATKEQIDYQDKFNKMNSEWQAAAQESLKNGQTPEDYASYSKAHGGVSHGSYSDGNSESGSSSPSSSSSQDSSKAQSSSSSEDSSDDKSSSSQEAAAPKKASSNSNKSQANKDQSSSPSSSDSGSQSSKSNDSSKSDSQSQDENEEECESCSNDDEESTSSSSSSSSSKDSHSPSSSNSNSNSSNDDSKAKPSSSSSSEAPKKTPSKNNGNSNSNSNSGSSNSNSGSGILGGLKNIISGGQGTFFTPGLGSCGQTNSDSDYIVALSADLMSRYDDGNPNNNSLCNKKIKVEYQGKEVEATVTDTCPPCTFQSIDLSPAAFNQLSAPEVGRISGLKWAFTDGTSV